MVGPFRHKITHMNQSNHKTLLYIIPFTISMFDFTGNAFIIAKKDFIVLMTLVTCLEKNTTAANLYQEVRRAQKI